MAETIKKYLNDSFAARWTALILVASMMFFAYMFVDVLSPLSTLLETTKSWTAENYGTFCSSEYFLNVFAFFLIFAGIILDKMGIRFTGVLSGAVMVIGASIKLYALSDLFTADSALYSFLNSFWTSFPPTAKLAWRICSIPSLTIPFDIPQRDYAYSGHSGSRMYYPPSDRSDRIHRVHIHGHKA